MRARLIFTALVAVVALLTVGAATGVAQGLDSSDSSAAQQYGTTESLGVIGEVETVEPPATGNQPTPQPAPAPQASGQLPFTGFAALTTLILGAALLGGGLVLRRGSRRRHDAAG